jgi:hypothetical protein
MKLTKKTVYIGLFAILYLIVAFSSFFHACAFFGLANNSWMSVILAFAFEIGQAAVLFSLLTSTKDRGRVMPWVLMFMFTLVQVIGNVFSSYKYLILNSVEDLKYFKEPIFIWTDLPDQEATVIVTWAIGAILPISALLLTSMITNYLTDQEEEKKEQIEEQKDEEIVEEPIKEEIKEENEQIEFPEDKSDNDNGEQPISTVENETITNSEQPKIDESYQEGDKQSNESDNSEIKDLPKDDEEIKENITKEFNDDKSDKQNEEKLNKPSHFINL